jgi:hypothetical protein
MVSKNIVWMKKGDLKRLSDFKEQLESINPKRRVDGSSPKTMAYIQEEQNEFTEQVSLVQKWWKSERFALVDRPYSAEDGSLVLM